MKRNYIRAALLFTSLTLIALACGILPAGVNDAPEPAITDAIPSPSWTVVPPTMTAVPPTPTATPLPQAIEPGNVQRLVKAWEYTVPSDSFRTVGFSPDGHYLAGGTGGTSNSTDERLHLWDVQTGQQIAESERLNTIIWEVQFSPDGRMIAAGLNSNSVQLRDGNNLNLISRIDFPGPVNSLSFSPDGTRLAAGVASPDGGQVIVVDLASGEYLLEFWAHSYSIPSLDYSPDGSRIASGAVDRYVKIWDGFTGGLIRTQSQDSQGGAVRFSPDGFLLASGHCEEFVGYDCLKGMVLVWSTSSWEVFRTLVGPLERVISVVFSPDVSLLIGSSNDGYLNFWRLSDGILLHQVEGNYAGLEAVSITSDGRYLATATLSKVTVWQISE